MNLHDILGLVVDSPYLFGAAAVVAVLALFLGTRKVVKKLRGARTYSV
jgi:hypothetical protein